MSSSWEPNLGLVDGAGVVQVIPLSGPPFWLSKVVSSQCY